MIKNIEIFLLEVYVEENGATRPDTDLKNYLATSWSKPKGTDKSVLTDLELEDDKPITFNPDLSDEVSFEDAEKYTRSFLFDEPCNQKSPITFVLSSKIEPTSLAKIALKALNAAAKAAVGVTGINVILNKVTDAAFDGIFKDPEAKIDILGQAAYVIDPAIKKEREVKLELKVPEDVFVYVPKKRPKKKSGPSGGKKKLYILKHLDSDGNVNSNGYIKILIRPKES